MTYTPIQDKNTLRVGEFYMGRRYHNAKRIVWEAFKFTGFVSDHHRPNVQNVRGTWLSDGTQSNDIWSIAEFDIRWVDRKIKELKEEKARIDAGLAILEAIH